MRSGAAVGALVQVTMELEAAVVVSKSAADVSVQVLSHVRVILDTT